MNNNIKKLMILFLIILFITVPLSFAENNSYTLGNINKDIVIKDDGTSIITEDITYKINDNINGVYRSITLSGGQSIDNVSVETPGYYNKVEVINQSNNVTIKVWLYSDEEMTKQVPIGDIRVIYHYNFNKGVKIYNDIAEFQYTSWDNGWGTGVEYLQETIHIPGSSSQVEYWNNPPKAVKESKWENDDTLSVYFNKLSPDDRAEQRLLMPKEYFKSTDNCDVIDKDAKSHIEGDQQSYAFQESIKDNFGYIAAAISVIFMIIPFIIKFRHSNRKQSIYRDALQTQIPSDDSPLFINILLNGIVGEVNSDAYNATLLDLIDRRYFKVLASTEDDTIIRPTSKDTADLKRYELDVYEFVSNFVNNEGDISFKRMTASKTVFSQFMNAWTIDTSHEVTSLDVRRFFDDTSSNQIVFVSFASFILAIVLLFFAIFVFKGAATNIIAIVFAIILLVESVLLFASSNSVTGQWTDTGVEFRDKWINFKKYLMDYSMLKEYPPASIQVWGRYLVYATALGCADEVRKNMMKYFETNNMSDELLYDTGLILLLNSYAFRHMFFYPHVDMPDLGGSFGDIGGPGSGGFGGGGGGVF